MSDSESSLDSNGIPKCCNPPKSKEQCISQKTKIEASESSQEENSDDSDCRVGRRTGLWEAILGMGSGSKRHRSDSSDSSRSPSPKRQRTRLNEYKHYDKSDDEEDARYLTEIPASQELVLRIKYCTWSISCFSTCELNTEGYLNSNVYSAGMYNEVQWYFRIERFRQGKEVFYGVYVHHLTHIQDEATLEFRAYIIEHRGHSYRLAQASKFPQKKGFQFLGFARKSHIRDDSYWYYRMIPDDELTLSFRIHIQFKKSKNQLFDDFKSLLDSKTCTDFNLVVKGNKFPVHRAILAARSSVFADMFNKKKAPIEHEFVNVEPDVMKDLLKYLYTGRLKRLIKYLKDFSTIADKYNLRELKSICDKAKLSFQA
ncbi:speckle-type POZ protein A-like [Copidosoma floridanum]|uniref:speckle-type POZ protein A-like n=1 Tax=Copidosoma floridanum TaxID=29053 RepID=UPI0006C9C4D8|nr:speckle-type POZ protein A-like [Copidosoma floridanum]